MAKQRGKATKRAPRKRVESKSDYFMQPGKRGAVIVLRKPCGNRAAPKICGAMPSRAHAKLLVNQLERAESAVNDLFLEATDDGIEALEAVLAACRDEVLRKGGGPRVPQGAPRGTGKGQRPDPSSPPPPPPPPPAENGRPASDASTFAFDAPYADPDPDADPDSDPGPDPPGVTDPIPRPEEGDGER